MAWAWLLLLGLLARPGFAQDEQSPPPQLSAEQARRSNSIARNTMSPFCPGRTLADCPSPNAADWRADIRKWVAEGLSAEQIRARLERRVDGGTLSGSPSTSLGWALPVLLAVVSIGLLAVILRRVSNPKRAQAPLHRNEPDPDVDDELNGTGDEQDDDVDHEPSVTDDETTDSSAPDDDELEARLKRELEREDL